MAPVAMAGVVTAVLGLLALSTASVAGPADGESQAWARADAGSAVRAIHVNVVSGSAPSLSTPQRPSAALSAGPSATVEAVQPLHAFLARPLAVPLVAAVAAAVSTVLAVLFQKGRTAAPGVAAGTDSYGAMTVALAASTGTPAPAEPTATGTMARPPLQIFGENEKVFCYMTMVKRMPAIARDIINDNDFLTAQQAGMVEEVAVELESQGRGLCREVERLKADTTVPEKASDYERSLFQPFAPYVGKMWRETPWLHGEIYFYHRLLQATGWYSHKKDIFWVPKMKSLQLSEQSMVTLTNAVVDDGHVKPADQPAMLDKLIHSCLWGNKVDLCLFKVDDFSDAGVQSKGKDASVMCDNTAEVVAYLQSLRGKGQIDFILDNFGYELFTDLVLTYFLLEYNWTEKVVLHCKMQPYYVSDALEKDVAYMLDHLIGLGAESARVIGQTLKGFHAQGRLQWTSHPFWMAPSEFYDMPGDVRDTLRQSALVFVKGDLNYRRLVGDRHWPFTTPFSDAVSYFPTPLVALRTNKSEVLVGVDEEALAYVKGKEPNKWLVSGNFGLIQFWKP